MRGKLSQRSQVTAVKDQVSCDLAGEAVILNLKSGVYYGLNAVGARIWQLIQAPRTVASVWETLHSEYEVEPDRCAQDVMALLQALADAGLIEIVHDMAP
jgi:hypothetical protein